MVKSFSEQNSKSQRHPAKPSETTSGVSCEERSGESHSRGQREAFFKGTDQDSLMVLSVLFPDFFATKLEDERKVRSFLTHMRHLVFPFVSWS